MNVSQLSPGTVLQNRYRIVRVIGKGGMGQVYEATHERLGNKLALKQTLYANDQDLLRAFEREAHLLAALRHPALPKVHDYFPEGDNFFLVMEYIDGDNLEELLKAEGRAFPSEQALGWAERLLDVLKYLHTREPRIVHRDIKPANIKLTARGEVILLDFGLAKGSVTGMTTVVSLPGATLAYAPLEQCLHLRTDNRSDLYSLAATLYHLVTNIIAPPSVTRNEAIKAGGHDPLKPADELNPEVPPAFAAVLLQAMALDGKDRPSSAADMELSLRVVSRSLTAPLRRKRWQAAEVKASHSLDLFSSFVRDEEATRYRHEPYGDAPVVSKIEFLRGAQILVVTGGASGLPETVFLDARGGDLKPLDLGGGSQIVAHSPGGELLVLTSDDGTTSIYDTQTLQITSRLPRQGGNPGTISFSPDGNYLLRHRLEGDSSLWSCDGRLMLTLTLQEKQRHRQSFSPDGKLLINHVDSYSRKGNLMGTRVEVWEVKTGQLLQTSEELSGKTQQPAQQLVFSPDYRIVAHGAPDQVQLRETLTGDLLFSFPTSKDNPSVSFERWRVEGMSFSPGGRLLAVYEVANNTVSYRYEDQQRRALRLWDTATGEPVLTVPGLTGPFIFSPGERMLVGRDGSTTQLWDLERGQKVLRLRMQESESDPDTWMNSFSFSQDGEKMVRAGEGVSVWDTKTGNLLFGYAGKSQIFTFTPSRRNLAVGGEDGTISLWDTETSQLITVLAAHSKPVGAIAFAPAQNLMASGGQDFVVRLYEMGDGWTAETVTG